MMTSHEKYQKLRNIFWDYNVELLPLNKIVECDLKSIDDYELKFILNRMFERLSWYDLLEILGIPSLKYYLTQEAISKIRFVELREKI